MSKKPLHDSMREALGGAYKACTSKRLFLTRRSAKAYIKGMSGGIFLVYLCRYCNNYHVAAKRKTKPI